MTPELLDSLLQALGLQVETIGEQIQADGWRGVALKTEQLRTTIEAIDMAVRLKGGV